VVRSVVDISMVKTLSAGYCIGMKTIKHTSHRQYHRA